MILPQFSYFVLIVPISFWCWSILQWLWLIFFYFYSNCWIAWYCKVISSSTCWVYLTNIPLSYTQGHIAQWLRASLCNGEGPRFKPWSGHFYYVQQSPYQWEPWSPSLQLQATCHHQVSYCCLQKWWRMLNLVLNDTVKVEQVISRFWVTLVLNWIYKVCLELSLL